MVKNVQTRSVQIEWNKQFLKFKTFSAKIFHTLKGSIQKKCSTLTKDKKKLQILFVECENSDLK